MIFKEIASLTLEERKQIFFRGTGFETELVKDIITSVKARGDDALKEYTKRFDRAALKKIRMTEEEMIEARRIADPKVVEAIEKAHKNIESFHKRQVEQEWWLEENDRRIGQILRPVESVGCYVPGGKAFYPSTVLMSVTPAKVAGVKRIAVTTPPRPDGKINEHTLVA